MLSLLVLIASSTAICQGSGAAVKARCSENKDKLYVRPEVLEQFADILTASLPESERAKGYKFQVINERAWNFGIYDLTDLGNVDATGQRGCIEFINHHVYHVVPVLYDFSFSHIIILEDGNLKVFRSINCRDRGDKVEDVIKYLSLKLAHAKNKNKIIRRVRNYRRYGDYVRMDNFSSLMCEPIY